MMDELPVGFMRFKAFYCTGHSLTGRPWRVNTEVPQSASYMLGAQLRVGTWAGIELTEDYELLTYGV